MPYVEYIKVGSGESWPIRDVEAQEAINNLEEIASMLQGSSDEILSNFGLTASAAELNHCDGVTSNVQTQLNSKMNMAADMYSSSSDSDESNFEAWLDGRLNSMNNYNVKVISFAVYPYISGNAAYGFLAKNDNSYATVVGWTHGGHFFRKIKTGGTWQPTKHWSQAIFESGNMILSGHQYGPTLPAPGTAGRIFFKKV